MVTRGHKRSTRTATQSSLSAHMPRHGHAKLNHITQSSRKIRIPFTDTSSSSEDTEDTPPVRPKRANSDPPEDTEDMFQATKPVFSSFQTKGWDKPKTRQAKRHETTLRLSFVMDELMQGKRKHRPSLAVADGHPIPPLLPVHSESSQSSIPETLSHLTPPTTPPNPKIKAIRATGARISLASDELASMSFYKKTPGEKLVSVPEHPNSGPTGQRPSFRGPGYFQSFGSLPRSGVGSSLAGSTGTPGGTPTNEDVDMPDSQSSGYMPRTSRKDQGYGFSYSDSSDNEEGQAVDHDWEMTQTPIINPNTSFKDVVVMRDIARNWTFRQPSVLPCTHAKLEYV